MQIYYRSICVPSSFLVQAIKRFLSSHGSGFAIGEIEGDGESGFAWEAFASFISICAWTLVRNDREIEDQQCRSYIGESRKGIEGGKAPGEERAWGLVQSA